MAKNPGSLENYVRAKSDEYYGKSLKPEMILGMALGKRDLALKARVDGFVKFVRANPSLISEFLEGLKNGSIGTELLQAASPKEAENSFNSLLGSWLGAKYAYHEYKDIAYGFPQFLQMEREDGWSEAQMTKVNGKRASIISIPKIMAGGIGANFINAVNSGIHEGVHTLGNPAEFGLPESATGIAKLEIGLPIFLQDAYGNYINFADAWQKIKKTGGDPRKLSTVYVAHAVLPWLEKEGNADIRKVGSMERSNNLLSFEFPERFIDMEQAMGLGIFDANAYAKQICKWFGIKDKKVEERLERVFSSLCEFEKKPQYNPFELTKENMEGFLDKFVSLMTQEFGKPVSSGLSGDLVENGDRRRLSDIGTPKKA